ncbi:MAG: DUF6438 domain-containing protein [Bacteroidia bacterium]
MKTHITMLFFLLTVKLSVANDIDKLKTNEDVQNFLRQKVDTAWKKYDFFEVAGQKDTSAYGKGKFFKLDLDNNGLTDLIVNGKYFFAVTDNGNGHYDSHFIDRGTFMLDKHTLKNIVYKDKTPLLLICSFSEYSLGKFDNSITDTLALKFGEFYEYNPTPDNFKIEDIIFSTSPCYGTCPIFELTIKADRTAKYDAQEYNDKKGKFKTTLDSTSYDKLVQTINYIKLTSLKNKYSVNWTDDQTATLEVKFNNGQIKKITDYGEIGTFGLEHLYDQLFALRKTQKWQ